MLARLVTSPLAPYLAAGALLSAFAGGWVVRGWRCDAALVEALQGAERQRAQLQAEVEASAAAYEQERSHADNANTAREVQIRTIYRDRPAVAGCDVDPAARRVLDAARVSANASITGEPGVPVPSIATDP